MALGQKLKPQSIQHSAARAIVSASFTVRSAASSVRK